MQSFNSTQKQLIFGINYMISFLSSDVNNSHFEVCPSTIDKTCLRTNKYTGYK